jgi:FlaA1/EpsC-like NDP-sugar epimerase
MLFCDEQQIRIDVGEGSHDVLYSTALVMGGMHQIVAKKPTSKILITGGTGFIGSHICTVLMGDGPRSQNS